MSLPMLFISFCSFCDDTLALMGFLPAAGLLEWFQEVRVFHSACLSLPELGFPGVKVWHQIY